MRGLTRQLVLWTVLSVPLGAVSEARVTVDLPLASSGPSSVKSAAESSDYSSASLRINRGRHAASLLFSLWRKRAFHFAIWVLSNFA